MNKVFRPELMTRDIVYCQRSHCPRAKSCLRHLAYEHAAPFAAHTFLDPRGERDGAQCSDYLSDEVQQVGRGFKAAMRLAPYGKVRHLQARLCEALGCGRSHFYRYASGEQALSRAQTEQVRAVFAELGITQIDLFDRWEEAYHLPY